MKISNNIFWSRWQTEITNLCCFPLENFCTHQSWLSFWVLFYCQQRFVVTFTSQDGLALPCYCILPPSHQDNEGLRASAMRCWKPSISQAHRGYWLSNPQSDLSAMLLSLAWTVRCLRNSRERWVKKQGVG